MADGGRRLENYRKRSFKEMDQDRRYAALPLARDLLPTLDNLHRALDAARNGGDVTQLAQGVQMVARQFDEILAKHSSLPIAAVDKPFDPNLHQALQQVPSPGKPPLTVLAECERGYKNARSGGPAQHGHCVGARNQRVPLGTTDADITITSANPAITCGREFPVHHVEADEEVPRVWQAKAKRKIGPGAENHLQRLGLLPDRLSQRFVQRRPPTPTRLRQKSSESKSDSKSESKSQSKSSPSDSGGKSSNSKD